MTRALDTSGFPAWLWLWAPLLWFPMQFVFRALEPGGELYSLLFDGEFGSVEMLTAGLLIPAAIFAARAGRELWTRRNRFPAVMLFLYAFGCIFLMLEEISYGQHIFQWDSPEYFQGANLQQETNLHNLGGVDKSTPKWIMIIGMAIGGIVLPLEQAKGRLPKVLLSRPLLPLLPTGALLPTAAVALVSHLAAKILKAVWDLEFHHTVFVNVRETTELYIAFFLFLYAWGVARKVRA